VRPGSSLNLLAERLARAFGLYAAGAVGEAVSGLVTIAVVTRFLSPAEFGRYSVLIVITGLLAVIYDLGILQGTLRATFATITDVSQEQASARRRQAMTTGLLVTLAVGTGGTLALWLASRPLASVLLAQSRRGPLIVYAALTGMTLASARLVINQYRYQRRPGAFSLLTLSRAAFTLAATVPLLARSPSAGSAVLGAMIGSLATLLAAVFTARHDFAARPALSSLSRIWREGMPWIPVALAVWTLNASGVLIVSLEGSAHEAGIYRAAARIGAICALCTGLFFMAWGPFMRSSLYEAARREMGADRLSQLFATGYVIGVATVLASITIASHELARIAGGQFRSSAALIPVLAVPGAIYGLVRLSYLNSTSRTKVREFRAAMITAAIVFAIVAGLSVKTLGAYGVVAGQSLGLLAAGALMLRSGARVPLEPGRTARALTAAASCVLLHRWVAFTVGQDRPINDYACLVALPVMLIVLGAVRPSEVAAIPALAFGNLEREQRRVWHERIAGLEEESRERLRELLGSGNADAAQMHSAEPADGALTWFAWIVRAIADGGPSPGDDRLLARYLLSTSSAAIRDPLANELLARHEDPLAIDRMSRMVAWMRRLSDRRWRTLALEPGTAAQTWLTTRGDAPAEPAPPLVMHGDVDFSDDDGLL
jgi:O-antigen/teichoic acid export membrane protein